MTRLGTRASALALAQAGAVAERLRGLGVAVEIVPMRTEGDRLIDARLASVGGKGLFVREIEEALLRGEIDLAVHSLKDLPAEVPEALCLRAFPEREDPRDVLVGARGGGLAGLREGAVVGTSSPRRRALALSLRPDLTVEPIRGNVDTRLRKLQAGEWDAVILAAAGLRRLGLTPAHVELLATDVFVPAVGQGILAVEARLDDRETARLVGVLDHPLTRACALAERACLGRLGASCNTAVGAHARVEEGRVRMTGMVASEDGRSVLRASADGALEGAAEIGLRLAESLLGQGAASLAALAPRATAGGGARPASAGR